MKKLTQYQLNSLLTGNELACELDTSNKQIRTFITLKAYKYDFQNHVQRLDKFLKSIESIESDNINFFIRQYGIDKSYIDNDWDVVEDVLEYLIEVDDINSLEQLENELLKLVDDLSVLIESWKTDNSL